MSDLVKSSQLWPWSVIYLHTELQKHRAVCISCVTALSCPRVLYFFVDYKGTDASQRASLEWDNWCNYFRMKKIHLIANCVANYVANCVAHMYACIGVCMAASLFQPWSLASDQFLFEFGDVLGRNHHSFIPNLALHNAQRGSQRDETGERNKPATHVATHALVLGVWYRWRGLRRLGGPSDINGRLSALSPRPNTKLLLSLMSDTLQRPPIFNSRTLFVQVRVSIWL